MIQMIEGREKREEEMQSVEQKCCNHNENVKWMQTLLDLAELLLSLNLKLFCGLISGGAELREWKTRKG